MVVDAQTGQRHPIWVEIDSNASTPALTALEVHPAVNFEPGHRYIVAMRDLRDASGGVIPAPGGLPLLPRRPALEARRRSTAAARTSSRCSSTLRGRGHPPLGPLPRLGLHRGQRREQLAADAPHPRPRLRAARRHRPRRPRGRGRRPGLHRDDGRRVHRGRERGRRPARARHLHGPLLPAAELRPGRDASSSAPTGCRPATATGRPTSTASSPAARSTARARSRAGPAPYGHGLFGSASEVFGVVVPARAGEPVRLRLLRDRRDRDVRGRRSDDGGGILANLSNFPRLADRLQQGLLNELFLGRLMLHPDGLLSDAGVPRGRDDARAAPASSTPPSSTTSAPARAGSWAARSPPSPRTSPARR